jgi:Methyltransferase domain
MMITIENLGDPLPLGPVEEGQADKNDVPSNARQNSSNSTTGRSLTPTTTTRGSRTLVRKRHGSRNQDRHKIFVKWLMETFDLSDSNVPDGTENDTGDHPCCQQQQQHILDVAGGKGEVSARLTMCQRQRVVMVDPRPANVVDCFERQVLPKIPNKWQQKLEQQRQQDPDFVRKIMGVRFHQLVSTFDDTSLSSNSELQLAVENSTILLGLHADGATEAIVDAAIRHNKPFVVVPCCVFPNFFPLRFLQEEDDNNNHSGRMVPVRSHEQFCKYLVKKDPRFVLEELPFAGKNIAIWWDGK